MGNWAFLKNTTREGEIGAIIFSAKIVLSRELKLKQLFSEKGQYIKNKIKITMRFVKLVSRDLKLSTEQLLVFLLSHSGQHSSSPAVIVAQLLLLFKVFFHRLYYVSSFPPVIPAQLFLFFKARVGRARRRIPINQTLSEFFAQLLLFFKARVRGARRKIPINQNACKFCGI